jgi:hypothetical protein
MKVKWSKRTIQILQTLSDGHNWTEDSLKTSNLMMQRLWRNGLIEGAGRRDDKGDGNYPSTRVWWITDKGLSVLAGDA